MKYNPERIDRMIKEEYKRYLERCEKLGREEFKRRHKAEIVDAANQYEL